MKLLVSTQMLVPILVVKQVLRQWLDEYLRLEPNQVLACIFSDEYAAAQKPLSVQGPGSIRQARKPEITVNGVESRYLQVER